MVWIFISSVLDGETLTSILQTVCSCMLQTSWRGHCSMRILNADCSPNPRVPWTFGTISIEFPQPIETQKIHYLTKHRSGNRHLSLVCFLAPGKEMCESEYQPMKDEQKQKLTNHRPCWPGPGFEAETEDKTRKRVNESSLRNLVSLVDLLVLKPEIKAGF